MAFHKHALIALWLHRIRVKLHTPDRRDIGASPVEVHPPVIVNKQVGIPERKTAFNLLVGAVQNILRAVPVTVLFPPGSAEIHPVAHHPHIGSVVVQGQFPGKPVVFPCGQIIGHPYPQGHGGENIIPAVEEDHGRIRGLPADLHLPVLARIHVKLIAVVDIDWITEILHSCTHLLSP